MFHYQVINRNSKKVHLDSRKSKVDNKPFVGYDEYDDALNDGECEEEVLQHPENYDVVVIDEDGNLAENPHSVSELEEA